MRINAQQLQTLIAVSLICLFLTKNVNGRSYSFWNLASFDGQELKHVAKVG